MTATDINVFERAAREQAKRRNGNGQAGKQVEPFPLEGPNEFLALKRPRFVVPALIPEDGTFLLFAPSGHYKTTLMLLILVLAANSKALDGSDIHPVPLMYRHQ